jgi:hypothetical protein
MCKVNIAADGRRILPQVWLGEEDTVLGTAFSLQDRGQQSCSKRSVNVCLGLT